ncbi:MAG: hypothetical protein OXI53_09970 [Nitrospira sp.]|nr:hypothetical protein [Nitrospira sp.]MDE0405624.1 hypothetical protein [Nitrospira sp.]
MPFTTLTKVTACRCLACPGVGPREKQKQKPSANIEAAIREYFSVVDDLLGDAEVREIELAV